MLAEETRLLGQRQRTLLFMAQQAAWTFYYVSSSSPSTSCSDNAEDFMWILCTQWICIASMNLGNIPPFRVILLFVPEKDVPYRSRLLAANARNGLDRDLVRAWGSWHTQEEQAEALRRILCGGLPLPVVTKDSQITGIKQQHCFFLMFMILRVRNVVSISGWICLCSTVFWSSAGIVQTARGGWDGSTRSICLGPCFFCTCPLLGLEHLRWLLHSYIWCQGKVAGISGAGQRFFLSINGHLRGVGPLPWQLLPFPRASIPRGRKYGNTWCLKMWAWTRAQLHIFLFCWSAVSHSLPRIMHRGHRSHLSKGMRSKKFLVFEP